MVVGNEPELTLHIEYNYSKRFTEPLRQRGSFLGACWANIWLSSIGKPGFRFWNPDFGFCNRTRNPFSDFTRNPNPDFMDFLLTVRLGNPKKDLQNCSRQERSFFLLIMHARARPLFLRTVSFKSLSGFPNRTVKRKSKNRFLSVEIRFQISRSIADPKSGF